MLAIDIVVHQTQDTICSAGGFWCTVNSDTLVSTGIAMAVTLLVGLFVAARVRSGRPGKMQMLFEAVLGYVRRMTHDTVAEDAEFIVPIAMTLAFFILVANWIDFFPLSKPVIPANSDWNLTLAMALIVFFVVQGYAIKVKGFVGYMQHSPAAGVLIPTALGGVAGAALGAFGTGLIGGAIVGVGIAAVGVMTRPHREMSLGITLAFLPLTVVEELVKPVTLSLRLFGNILAGVIMVSLIPQLFPSWVNWLPLAIWKAFDVFFIGSIQALIFMLLTIIYFGMAREGLEEHGDTAAAHQHA